MKKQIRVTTICPVCEKAFEYLASRKKTYCGNECYYQARRNGTYPAYWLGKTRSEESMRKVSEANKGRKPWCTGLKLTEEHRKKLSEARKGRYVGVLHPNWSGGRRLDERGYVRIWVGSKSWRYEHILVMEKIIGRPLKKGEVVHHVNNDSGDNRPQNLMLFPNNAAHLKYHALHDTTYVKNQYGGFPHINRGSVAK